MPLDDDSRHLNGIIDDLVREAGTAAAGYNWSIGPSDVLEASRPSRTKLVRGGAGLVLIAAVLIGIFVVPLPQLHPFHAATTPLTAQHPVRTGAVTGFLEPCEGRPIPGLPYAAGTVTAYRGQPTYKKIAPGAYRMVLPTTFAARQYVGRNQRFDLELAPGHYFLVATYDGSGNVGCFLDVQIAAGTTLRVNMLDVCK
jgi:hypothetical protein